MQYTLFDNFIFRTPLYPIANYNNKALWDSNLFNEALLLASPDFYREKDKNNANYNKRMQMSLYKYLTRASTRCTPFGLFAGCSFGQFGVTENIKLVTKNNYQRTTRLDTTVLCALTKKIEEQEFVRKQLKFYPNDSTYQLGGRLRYVEYSYRGLSRIHRISSVDLSDYLLNVLRHAKNGHTLDELAYYIIDKDVSSCEAREFIEELVKSQLLKSELEISVTGEDQLDLLIYKLTSLNKTEMYVSELKKIQKILKTIDENCEKSSIYSYEQIINIIKNFGINYDSHCLFQADLLKPTVFNTLSKKSIEGIDELICFLNKITPKIYSVNLNEFCKAFTERYGEQAVPLLQVLDTELGIGYLQNTKYRKLNTLGGRIHDEKSFETFRFTDFDIYLLQQYLECIEKHENTINLNDNSLNDYINWDDLPPTFSVLCSILNDGVYIKSVGGTCAANLLTRFCHINTCIDSFVKEIIHKELDLVSKKDIVIAEIVHLPEDRVGNILLRPKLRDYEIHYLTKPAVTKDFAISLDDLMIKVRNNKVILMSKKLQKEICPRLTTAHNYVHNSLPVYQFLSELQIQNMRSNLNFKWNDIFFKAYNYLPRIKYKHFILSRQRWKIVNNAFYDFSEKEINTIWQQRNIPSKFIVPDGDNELLIDIIDKVGRDLFVSLLKKRKILWIEEFLSPSDIVSEVETNEVFCNEFIFSYYKTE